MGDESVVLYDVNDHVATITINRPERRNALSHDVLTGLIEKLGLAKSDSEVRVVVLTGAGDKAFCAGADLGGFQAEGGPLGAHEERRLLPRLFLAIVELGKPIVARVNGHALAGGLGVMLMCDLAVAADDATLGTTEIRVGLWPMMIMAVIFRNIGRKKGLELLMTGDRIEAAEALRLGMLNYVVPRDGLDKKVEELVDKLRNKSPAVMKLGRDAFYAMSDMEFTKALEYLRGELSINLLAEDAMEGVAAFLEKREPKWKGR